MKKMFTSVLAMTAALAMNAETTTTIWEGNETAAWDKRIEIPCNWNTVSEGDVLTFTAVTGGNDENYATFHLLDGSWNEVVKDLSFPYAEGATQTHEFTMAAEALDAARNDGGLGVQGFGFTLTKIELTSDKAPAAEVEDAAPALLWTGEQSIGGWGSTSLVLNEETLVAPFKAAYTGAANMYILVEGDGDLRISGAWGDWGETAFPSDGYNHMGTKDADNVVKVALSDDFVQKAFAEGEGFAIWGSGDFTVKAIGTTKDTVLNANPTGIETITIPDNGIRYNLLGQEVGEDYKGIVILNGSKMMVR